MPVQSIILTASFTRRPKISKGQFAHISASTLVTLPTDSISEKYKKFQDRVEGPLPIEHVTEHTLREYKNSISNIILVNSPTQSAERNL